MASPREAADGLRQSLDITLTCSALLVRCWLWVLLFSSPWLTPARGYVFLCKCRRRSPSTWATRHDAMEICHSLSCWTLVQTKTSMTSCAHFSHSRWISDAKPTINTISYSTVADHSNRADLFAIMADLLNIFPSCFSSISAISRRLHVLHEQDRCL